jgi:hypothetical protein
MIELNFDAIELCTAIKMGCNANICTFESKKLWDCCWDVFDGVVKIVSIFSVYNLFLKIKSFFMKSFLIFRSKEFMEIEFLLNKWLNVKIKSILNKNLSVFQVNKVCKSQRTRRFREKLMNDLIDGLAEEGISSDQYPYLIVRALN